MKKLFGRDKPKPPKPAPGDAPVEVRAPSTPRPSPPADSPLLPQNHTAHASQRHDRPHHPSEDHWDLISETDSLQPLRPPALSSSQTPSLTSIHQTASPAPSPMPRSSSPFAPAPASPHIPYSKPGIANKDREQQVLRKKPPSSVPNAFAAVGILKALEPHHLEPVASHDQSEDGYTDTSLREEKKEKRGFWERAGHRDKDKDKERAREKEKEKEREKERERKEEDAHAELTRMIGYLTATASEDWSLVLEVCDRASANDANAKEAAKALRREFKYAEPAAQLSAARLWAIMLRNCTSRFVHHCTSRKFLDTLEDVLSSSRTSPVVRERLLEVLAAAAYASDIDGGFKALWRKVKPADKPDEGIPFDNEDAMFYPATPRHSAGPNTLQPPNLAQRPPATTRPSSHPQIHSDQRGTQRPPPTATPGKTRSSRNRVIPLEEDIRRLFQECKVGRGNANLLSESLTYAKPEDLQTKDIIKEFYARCRASQELISAQIPWAFAQAEKSRQAAGRTDAPPKEGRRSSERTERGERGERERAPSSPKKDKPDQENLTTEEKLLAAILAANEELLEALRQYDDLERVGIERDAQERSKKEVRMDRSRLRFDESEHSYYLEPGQPNHSGAGASSSRSPSPSPSTSPSPAPSLVITPTPSSNNHSTSHSGHPLPPIPHGSIQPNHHLPTNHAHPVAQQGSIQSLAPPPPAPHGPRSPTHRSTTPSPERTPAGRAPRTSLESNQSAARQQQVGGKLKQESSEEWSDLDADAQTPVRPSAKALGKRKVVEPPADEDRSFDPNDIFYSQPNDSFQHNTNNNSDESESEDGRPKNPWHRPIHYVYDAAAERTQQRIREGRLAAAALVGGVH
ncbi:hypothetical protein C8Q77DRAFT_1058522 [Trametes polyzona]|nr:hypothetical protein C8Q77DRAFT_1058522 [Trametes polyzona]